MSFRTRLGIDIDADASGVDSGVNRAGSKLGGLGRTAGLAGAAVAAGLAVAAGAALKLGNDAINAASDLEETLAKSRVVFGKHADDMESWASRADEALGLSQNAALSAATGFADMFDQIGFTTTQAAQMSTGVVELATDLGSFNNLETEDVLNRISGALRGEYDSLQAVIPNINAARVENEALAATGKTAATELTAQERATAVLAIVQKDGQKAAGDFRRTSDGLANSQRILRARLENVKTEIGEKLLPIKVKLVRFISDKLLPGMERLGNYLRDKLGPFFRRLGEFIQDKAIPAAQDVYKWFVEKIAPGLKRTLQPILEGIRDAWDKISKKVDENSDELETLGGWLQRIAEVLADDVFPILGQFSGKHLETLGTAIGGIIDLVGLWVQWMDWLIDRFDDVRDAINSLPDLPDIGLGVIGNLVRIQGPDVVETAPVPDGWQTPATTTAPAVVVDASLTVTLEGYVHDPAGVAAALEKLLRDHRQRIGTELALGSP